MRTRNRKTHFTAGLLAPLALCLPACADDYATDTMLFVVGVKAPEATCMYKADASGALYLGGTLDYEFRDSYNAVLIVGYQLVNPGSENPLRAESSHVTLKGAEVTIMDDQETVLAKGNVPGTGYVSIGSGAELGYGLLATWLIPPGSSYSMGQHDLFIVDVRAFGQTIGGSEVISKVALRYPIYTCTGCLIQYPQEAADPASPDIYICSGGDKLQADAPCRLGQDDPIDCRFCAATHQLCLQP